MILVGNQRGGANDLARHLMKDENDHVTLHGMRGFVADDLHGALSEAYAISRATRCKQFLFSLSLNPPREEMVATEVFEAAIERIEDKLGLSGQPRAIVFHEKDGRRHAHVVWSRIDAEALKAVQLSHTKIKLRDVSRELYREHGWKMPHGLADKSLTDPRNFTLAQWQQARRNGTDPREIKTAFQDAWAISDSKPALIHALEERGYYLARGDRRGFVVLDHRAEIFSFPRWAGVKTKDVRTRLGDEVELPSVADTKARIAADMLRKVYDLRLELHAKRRSEGEKFETRRRELVQAQKRKRSALIERLKARRQAEAFQRQQRYRTGLLGLWDRIKGTRTKIKAQNERETALCKQRDQAEWDKLVAVQLTERRDLTRTQRQSRNEDRSKLRDLKAARGSYVDLLRDVKGNREAKLRDAFGKSSKRTGRKDDRTTPGRGKPAPGLER